MSKEKFKNGKMSLIKNCFIFLMCSLVGFLKLYIDGIFYLETFSPASCFEIIFIFVYLFMCIGLIAFK